MAGRFNLARRPFVDTRPANLTAGILAVLVLGVSFVAVRTVFRYLDDSRRTREAITQLKAEIARLEDEIWKAADAETQEGIDCNIGKASCTQGTKASMTLVPVSDSDRELLKKVLNDVVVPKWAARCPGDCVKTWNDSVGKVVGIVAQAK